MKAKTAILSAISFSALLVSVPSQADVFNFELSGSRNATFSINSDQMPSFLSSSSFGDQISFDNVVGIYGGAAGTAGIGFGTGVFAALNVTGTSLGFTQFAGPDLFSLVNMKPVFNIGTFSLTSIVSGPSTIRITAAAAPAVPEPASWAMMMAGVAAIGGVLRRTRTRVAFA